MYIWRRRFWIKQILRTQNIQISNFQTKTTCKQCKIQTQTFKVTWKVQNKLQCILHRCKIEKDLRRHIEILIRFRRLILDSYYITICLSRMWAKYSNKIPKQKNKSFLLIRYCIRKGVSLIIIRMILIQKNWTRIIFSWASMKLLRNTILKSL